MTRRDVTLLGVMARRRGQDGVRRGSGRGGGCGDVVKEGVDVIELSSIYQLGDAGL